MGQRGTTCFWFIVIFIQTPSFGEEQTHADTTEGQGTGTPSESESPSPSPEAANQATDPIQDLIDQFKIALAKLAQDISTADEASLNDAQKKLDEKIKELEDLIAKEPDETRKKELQETLAKLKTLDQEGKDKRMALTGRRIDELENSRVNKPNRVLNQVLLPIGETNHSPNINSGNAAPAGLRSYGYDETPRPPKRSSQSQSRPPQGQTARTSAPSRIPATAPPPIRTSSSGTPSIQEGGNSAATQQSSPSTGYNASPPSGFSGANLARSPTLLPSQPMEFPDPLKPQARSAPPSSVVPPTQVSPAETSPRIGVTPSPQQLSRPGSSILSQNSISETTDRGAKNPIGSVSNLYANSVASTSGSSDSASLYSPLVTSAPTAQEKAPVVAYAASPTGFYGMLSPVKTQGQYIQGVGKSTSSSLPLTGLEPKPALQQTEFAQVDIRDIPTYRPPSMKGLIYTAPKKPKLDIQEFRLEPRQNPVL